MNKIKLLAILSTTMLLSGCLDFINPNVKVISSKGIEVENKTEIDLSVEEVNRIATICLDGVQYYYRNYDSRAFLTPVISKDTLKPKLCNE